MAYDEKFRQRAVEYKDDGHTFKEFTRIFGVNSQSYYNWKRLKKATGFYAPKATKKATRKRKIDTEELKSALKEKPDAYLRELAEKFCCSIPSIHQRLKQLNITYKKRRSHTLKNQKQPERNTSKN